MNRNKCNPARLNGRFFLALGKQETTFYHTRDLVVVRQCLFKTSVESLLFCFLKRIEIIVPIYKPST